MMESEMVKLAAQWGPFAGLLLLTLVGTWKLVMWTLQENAKRDAEHDEILRSLLPEIKSLCAKTDATNAIVERIEQKVDVCDVRTDRARAARG